MKNFLSFLICLVFVFSLFSCGSSSGGGVKGNKFPDGSILLFYARTYDGDVSNKPFIEVRPVISDAQYDEKSDYNTSNAIWSISPASAGRFAEYPFMDEIYEYEDPLQYGIKKLLWDNVTDNVSITIEVDGVKFSKEINLRKLLEEYDLTEVENLNGGLGAEN